MSLLDGTAPDLVTDGDVKPWKVLFQESSKIERWTKITRAMQLKDGCLVQTIILHQNTTGAFSMDSNLVYVPGVVIQHNSKGHAYIA